MHFVFFFEALILLFKDLTKTRLHLLDRTRTRELPCQCPATWPEVDTGLSIAWMDMQATLGTVKRYGRKAILFTSATKTRTTYAIIFSSRWQSKIFHMHSDSLRGLIVALG